MNRSNNFQLIINSLLPFIYLFIGLLFYFFPTINLPFGFDTWWIFIIQSSSQKLELPYFYNYIGIKPENIFSSIFSLYEYFGRLSFLDWARFWLLGKYFPDYPFVWRLVAIISMSFSLILWKKIYTRLFISNIAIAIVSIILFTDPQSLWLDWNKSESLAFLFFSLSCYYSTFPNDKRNYLGLIMIVMAIFTKETFLIGIPFLIFLRSIFNQPSSGKFFYIRIFSYFLRNKFLVLFGMIYSFSSLLLLLQYDFQRSYVLENHSQDLSFLHISEFIFSYFKLLLPTHFHLLFEHLLVFVSLFLIILFINLFFLNFLSKFKKNKLKIFEFNKSKKIQNGEIFIFPVISVILLFAILFMFGSLARRYSSPINIILITTVILIFPFIRLKIVNALKNKKYYFDLDIIIYYVLLIPTLIWIYKFSLILSVSLILILTLIFVLLYFVFNKNYINKYLTFVLIIIFLIPALDRTIVNVVVTRDIYNSWEEVNKKVNEFTEQDSLVEIILSRNMNIEQAISLESNSILNHRNDIQYFVDESKAKQIKEFNDFDLWHIGLFNYGKSIKYEKIDYTISIHDDSNVGNYKFSENFIVKIFNYRYGKYNNRYKYSLNKLN